MSRIREGRWDCNYCGTVGILGREQECPHCGRKRDKNIRFYLPSNSEYLSDDEASRINKNPDWACSFCDSLNSDNDNSCKHCGHTRDESDENYLQIQKKKEEELKAKLNENINSSEYNNSLSDEDNIEENNHSIGDDNYEYYNQYNEKKLDKEYKKIHRNKNVKKVVGISSVFLIFLTIILLLVFKSPQTLLISEMSWDRNISIEQLTTVDESDWSLPSGARLKYSQVELSHYQSVLDHYETKTREVPRERISGYTTVVVGTRDLGNGYFEDITSEEPIYETYYETETYEEPVYREEPVYATKYYYEIDKWLHYRDVHTKGKDKEPVWGEVILKDLEREGNKTEKYYITAKIEKENKNSKDKVYKIDKDIWDKLNVGDRIKAKVYGGILSDIELVSEELVNK